VLAVWLAGRREAGFTYRTQVKEIKAARWEAALLYLAVHRREQRFIFPVHTEYLMHRSTTSELNRDCLVPRLGTLTLTR
jgi:hypothetical protein